jgi:hypothetical protein
MFTRRSSRRFFQKNFDATTPQVGKDGAERFNKAARISPRALKRGHIVNDYGTTEEAAEKVIRTAKSSPQPLKRGHIFNDLRHE